MPERANVSEEGKPMNTIRHQVLPAHDFPQRIVYRFEAPATMRAHIEGVIDGKTRREDFHFVRGSCESN